MIKKNVLLWVFIGLSVIGIEPLGCMGSATGEDTDIEGVAFAEEWKPFVPSVEVATKDGVAYFFYDPSFSPCSAITQVPSTTLQLSDDKVIEASSYLVAWHKGISPVRRTLNGLVAKVKLILACNHLDHWDHKETPGFVVFDTVECALSSYPFLINNARRWFGMEPYFDEESVHIMPMQPMLELYRYFRAGGYKIVFISDAPDVRNNRQRVEATLKGNGYTTVDRLYLCPKDCKDSSAAYRAGVRRTLATEGTIIAMISPVGSHLQGEALGSCAIWVPSPFVSIVEDIAFYQVLHKAVSAAEKDEKTAANTASTAVTAAVSQSSSSATAASQSSVMSTVATSQPAS